MNKLPGTVFCLEPTCNETSYLICTKYYMHGRQVTYISLNFATYAALERSRYQCYSREKKNH